MSTIHAPEAATATEGATATAPAQYCVSCGAALTGGSFCGGCGRETANQAADAAQTTTLPTMAAVNPTPARTAGRPRRRTGAIVAACAVALSVGALSAFAVHSQSQTAADEEAAAQQVRQDAKAEAKAEKKRIEAKAEKLAAEKVAEQQAPPAQPAQAPAPAPAPASATSASAAGSWEGSMDSGQYSFSMDLSESDGGISGSMYQYDNSDGEDGTESLTGYREGNTIYLQGTSWSGAPSGWGLDSIIVTLSPDGDSMSGSFTCTTCSGTKDISGYRLF